MQRVMLGVSVSQTRQLDRSDNARQRGTQRTSSFNQSRGSGRGGGRPSGGGRR